MDIITKENYMKSFKKDIQDMYAKLDAQEMQYPSYISTNHYGFCLRASKDLDQETIVATADFEPTENEFIANDPSEDHKYVALMDVTAKGKAVYGKVRGKWKFCNHSCDPNCNITNTWKIVTNRTIKKDEELTTSYDALVYNFPWQDTWNFECKCNSEQCKKIIDHYRTDIIYPIKPKNKNLC